MAKTSDVAAGAAVPSGADIERAAAFAREPFLLDGEGPEALAPGTARRRALDAALSELDAGAENPSIEWRRDFSLLLGLERLLADEPPKLRDGAELNPHQVDALSGTLAELMAQQQVISDDERRNGDSVAAADGDAAPPEASEPSANGADPAPGGGEGLDGNGGLEGEDGELEEEELEEEDEEETGEDVLEEPAVVGPPAAGYDGEELAELPPLVGASRPQTTVVHHVDPLAGGGRRRLLRRRPADEHVVEVLDGPPPDRELPQRLRDQSGVRVR
jgi:ribonuclease E